MPAVAHSGKFGVVDGRSTVRNWGITESNEAKSFVASNTQSGTGRLKAIHDWTGSYASYGIVPLTWPGELFTFGGYTAPDTDISGTDGHRYTGPAIVDSVVMTWNWETGDILSYVVNFSGNGPLVQDVGVYADVTALDVPPVCLTKVQRGTPAFLQWADVTQVVWTVTAANQAFVNTDTIAAGICWRERRAGIIDFTLAVTETATLKTTLIPDLASDEKLRLFTDATLFYDIEWAHLENYSGITVDRETGAIIKRTANFGMNGFNPAVGFIKKPDTSNFWP